MLPSTTEEWPGCDTGLTQRLSSWEHISHIPAGPEHSKHLILGAESETSSRYLAFLVVLSP